MTAALYYPESWLAQRSALIAWASNGAAPIQTIWKNQDAPSPPKPYVALRLLTPPVSVGRADELNTRGVQVLLSQDATVYTVSIGDDDVSYLSGIGETLDEIRDALIAQINLLLPDTASIGAPATLSLAIDDDVGLAVNDTDLLGIKILQSYVGQAEMSVEVDGVSRDRDELANVIDALKLDTETDDTIEALGAAGLAVIGPLGSRRLSLVVNGLWDHRYGFDLRLRTLTRRVKVMDFIETSAVDGELTA